MNVNMVEWFRSGNISSWLRTLQKAKNEVLEHFTNLRAPHRLPVDQRLYHVERQEAEALRNIGRYLEARTLAEKLERQYLDLYAAQAAAWCHAIYLDAERMLASTDTTHLGEQYSLLEQKAALQGWKRLVARCRKGYRDIHPSDNATKQLGTHAFGVIGTHISCGRAHLLHGKYGAAEEQFQIAHGLIHKQNAAMLFERSLAEFGIAEAKRLSVARSSSKKAKEALAEYRRLLVNFSSYHSTWGVVRCSIGIQLLSGKHDQISTALEGCDKVMANKYLTGKPLTNAQPVLFDTFL